MMFFFQRVRPKVVMVIHIITAFLDWCIDGITKLIFQLIKCLVLMLDKELNSLSQVPSEALTDHTHNR